MDFGRKTDDLEENERKSENKIFLPLIIPNLKFTWTRSVTRIHKMLDCILHL